MLRFGLLKSTLPGATQDFVTHRGFRPMKEEDIDLPDSDLRPAAIFDYDGTLIRGDSMLLLLLFTLKHYPTAAGSMVALAACFPLFAMRVISRDGFKGQALKVLRPIPPDQREVFFREFGRLCLQPRLFEEGARRLEWHRKRGHLLILVSASVDLYLNEVARHLGFDHLVCSRAVLDPSPRLIGANCRGQEKLRRVLEEPFAKTIDWETSWGYGDSLADRPLLERCGNPVAVRPKPSLMRYCRKAGWRVQQW